jgi:hypothetical protein
MEGLLSNHLVMRLTLAAVGLAGMAMCTAGIGRVAASNNWTHPLSIVAYALGALALLIVIAGLVGWKLPLITTEWQAVVAVLVIIVAKVALTGLHGLP